MSGDCEIAQYYKWKERTARKDHACCECSALIKAGEKYLQVNACWDNRPDVYRQHLLCARACELVRDTGMNDDECVYYGGLFEWWDQAKDDCWIWDDVRAHPDFKRLREMLYRIRRRERESRPKAGV